MGKENRPNVAFGAVSQQQDGRMGRQEIRELSLRSIQSRIEKKTTESGRMKGKVGVITGVGPPSGIGTAAAKIYAREGASHLYLLDFVDRDLPNLAKNLERDYFGLKVTWMKGDAADSQTISNLVKRVIQEEGRLDFFFANAGIAFIKPKPVDGESQIVTAAKAMTRSMGEVEADEFSEVMRINALSVYLAVKFAAPAMGIVQPGKSKTVPGGSIVLTASVAGKLANAGPVPYSASKAAVISIAQTSSYELVGQNIRVNAICPGLIQTDMTKPAFDLANMAGKIDRMGVLNPMLRQGLPHEVAELAVWLSSEESSYVNGQALSVDGGLTASMPYIRARM